MPNSLDLDELSINGNRKLQDTEDPVLPKLGEGEETTLLETISAVNQIIAILSHNGILRQE